MRPLTGTLTGATVAVAIMLVAVTLRGEFRWLELIGAAAAFHGCRWLLINGGISPGYTDAAIEQHRARRAERRRVRRERDE